MRTAKLIAATVAGGGGSYLVLSSLDLWQAAAPWARIVAIAVATIYAAAFTVLGESFLEDLIKLVMIGVVAVVLWRYFVASAGLIGMGVAVGGVIGSVVNSLLPDRTRGEPRGGDDEAG